MKLRVSQSHFLLQRNKSRLLNELREHFYKMTEKLFCKLEQEYAGDTVNMAQLSVAEH